MKIHVDFTIEVPREHLDRLREMTSSDTNEDAATFVRGEAEEVIKRYLEEAGNVRSRTVQRDGSRVHEDYTW